MSEIDIFCLRLDGFERNIKTYWQELQVETDLCDVMLAYEDKQINTHKVILSDFILVLGEQLYSPLSLGQLQGDIQACIGQSVNHPPIILEASRAAPLVSGGRENGHVIPHETGHDVPDRNMENGHWTLNLMGKISLPQLFIGIM